MMCEYHFAAGEKMSLTDRAGNAVLLGDAVVDCCGDEWTVGGADAVMTTEGGKVLLSALLVRSLRPYQAKRVATMRGAIPGHFKA